MSKVLYSPDLSIEEIAKISGVSEASVRKYIRENFIDRNYDSQLIKFRRVQQYLKDNPDATNTEAAAALGVGYSRNTIEKYRNAKNAPKPNGEKIYLTMSDPSMSKATVATVANEDRLILGAILRLYLKDDDRFECDLTFSKGDFYRYGVQYPRYCFDLYPKQPADLIDSPEVKPLADGYELPDNSLASVVIDLPQTISDNGHASPEAFRNLNHLATSYYEMLRLAYHKLRHLNDFHPGGIMVVKVGDIMWHGKTIWMSKIVTELATGRLTRISSAIYEELEIEAARRNSTFEKEFPLFDLELVDKYVHTFNPEKLRGEYANGHSIKAHDYFLVFRKGKEHREHDIFYYGTDFTTAKNRMLSGQIASLTYGTLIVSRKSMIDCKHFLEIKAPRKNCVNHIDLNSMVSTEIANAISKELEITIPFYACFNGEQFIKYLKEVVSNRMLEESAPDLNRRRIPTSMQVDMAVANILQKCGILFIQSAVSNRSHPNDCYRILLSEIHPDI